MKFLAILMLALSTLAHAKPASEPSNKYGPIQVVHNFFPKGVVCDQYPGEDGKVINFVKTSGPAGEGGGELTVSISDQSVSSTKEVTSMCQALKNAKAQKKSVELVGQFVSVAEPEGRSEIFSAVSVKLNQKPSE